MKSKTLLFLLILMTTMVAHGQNAQNKRDMRDVRWTSIKHPVKFKNLTTKDGLSQSSVLCIMQDSKGYIWFGTEDGLNKYDGYTFSIYRPDPENPYSISNNRIFDLYEDEDGILWIGTNGGGLNKFDRKTERFYHYLEDQANPFSLSDENIYVIHKDRSGTLWLGTLGGGLNKLIPGDKETDPPKFIAYKHDPENPHSLSSNIVRAIFEDSDGQLWIGSELGGLDKLVPGKDKNAPPTFIRYSNISTGSGTSSIGNVMAINEDNNGYLWIGTETGLYKFNRKTETFSRYENDPANPKSISHNYIRRIYIDRAGLLWFGTDGGGLNKLVPTPDEDAPPTFVRYRHSSYNADGLTGNGIESIFEDRSGSLWVGVYNGGIHQLPLRDTKGINREKTQFLHIRHNALAPGNSLSHNSVNAVYIDRRGTAWVGTDGGGLNKIVPGKEESTAPTFVHYTADPGNPNSLSNNHILTLCEDRRGSIWIGTYMGGLDQMIPGKNGNSPPTFVHYRHDPENPDSLSHDFVYFIYEDHLGVLWIGTMGGGLNRLNRETGTFTRFTSIEEDPTTLSINYVFTIYEDRNHVLWIGTTYGLNKFDRESETFLRFSHDPENPESISSNFVSAIYQDTSGVLWLGTDGGGLNKYVPGKDKNAPPTFIRYTKRDGLPNDVISNILEDDRGNLWLSTNKGLSMFSPKTGTFKNYDVDDGLQGNEFNAGAAWKTGNGEMVFGGNNGVSVFHPRDLKDNTYVPPIVLTDFRISNRSVPVDQWGEGEIELSHTQTIFSFQFAALNFISPEKNRYAYKMEGLEDQWNYVGGRRFVTYTTLPPGDYVFRVKGSNNNNLWNEEGIRVKIKIIPPYWKTWWFRFLGIAVLLFVIMAFYTIRTTTIKKRAEYLEAHNIQLNNEIARRKKEEEARLESEHMYHTLFESIPDPILIFHREKRVFLDCNRAALSRYGYTLDELLKMTPDDLHAPDDKEVPNQDIESHKTKNGERLYVEIHTAPLEYKGQPAHVAIVRDVTHKLELEQQLFQARKMESVGRLAGGIAHDFNNILTVVVGYAEFILMKLEKENWMHKYIRTIMEAGLRAGDLTSKLLAFSRKQIIQPKIIDINLIISELETMLRRLIGEDIDIRNMCKASLVPIKADPVQIEQILVNLVVNARDAVTSLTDKNALKTITIETGQVRVDESFSRKHLEIEPGLYVLITVSDTGVGMSKDIKEKIFEPFFTTKAAGKGTGLGMATVYGIVRQNNGFIYVYSEPGQGTTVKIYWPAAQEQEIGPSKHDQIESRDLQRGSETLLFVEDDDHVREFSINILKKFGYNVYDASHGKEALNLLEQKNLSIDMLITDIVMPEMDGKELAGHFYRIFPNGRILYTTGYTEIQFIPEKEGDKEIHFLRKPFTIEILLKKIRHIFDENKS